MSAGSATARFRPTRCGIINLWDYRDEEFVFADGRMVLRGPNGSGKTKALEVLFPFVLDGRIEPRRLNPFAGEERTMKSNLLYRGQESTLGYVWMEFRRGEQVFTVGVGLRAQKQNDRLDRWHFVAPGQVGRDFSLIGADQRPLTAKQLGAEIGPERVLKRAADHRLAVDDALFGLGPQRYEQMLTLILTLRRPHLAKDLDPRGLSRALSDGLRPLDQSMIDEAAHSFTDMESVQRTLAELVEADTAASTFLSGYTTYVRTHARAAADQLTMRVNVATESASALVGALSRQQDAVVAQGLAEGRRSAAEDLRARCAARLDSLKASSAYRDREQLHRLAQVTAELGGAARRERETANGWAADHARRGDERAAAGRRHHDATEAVHRSAAALLGTAVEAGIGWQAPDNAADGALRERAAARAAARNEDVRAVRAVLAGLAEARRLAERTRLAVERAQEREGRARTAVQESETGLIAAREQLRAQLVQWQQRHRPSLQRLLGDDLEPTLSALDEATAALAPEAPTLTTVFAESTRAAAQGRRDELARERAQLATDQHELSDLRQQRDAVAQQRDQAPPPFAARTDPRDETSGPPLWQVVDFADGVDDVTAAAVEAALEAANLLDALVTAGPPGASDAQLAALPVAQRPVGATLADVLVPDPAAPDAALIGGVLASVALVETAPPGAVAAVSGSGRFWQGVLVGAHHKPHAEYIGAAARARRRAARLADLDARIVVAEEVVTDRRARIGVLTDGLAALDAAGRDLPRPDPVFAALRAVDRAAAELRLVAQALDGARAEHDQAVGAVGDQERSLARTAATHAMPTEQAAVDGVATLVGLFTRHAHDLDSAQRTEVTRTEQLAAADTELTRAASEWTASRNRADEADATLRDRTEELATLQAAVGSGADQVANDITDTTTALGAATVDAKAAQREVETAIAAANRLAGLVEGAENAVRSAVVEAQQDSRRLLPYARPDLRAVLRLADAADWPTEADRWPAPDQVVAAVAGADAAVPAVLTDPMTGLLDAVLTVTADLRPTEASLKSSRTRVSSALADLQNQLAAAGHDYRPEWESESDVIVVRVADEQGFSSIADFAGRIARARQDQELLLTESERKVLEDALLARLAQQIHERTTDARDLIAAMNTEMRRRRMSSGATVGIGWELADALDAERRGISRLLDREAARLSGDDLARMRAQFSSQIKDLHAARPDRPYAEILAEALDYRQWRAFVLTLVGPDGTESRLTTARHSTLSGGEQSASVHLPLFAAAHVLFSSAAPHCPRLLALDEAFAGIDDQGRSELFDLTAQFDLDLFMTGYDLWATYASVPACAHHDLAHSAVEHTVSALLLLWNGDEVVTDSGGDLAAELGSPGTRRVPGADLDGGL